MTDAPSRRAALLTREEAAAYLRVSKSQLEHGWGPPPLPGYRRPVMYSLRSIKRWLHEQEEACSSTPAAASSGASGNTKGRRTVSRRVKQIVARQRRKRAKSERGKKQRPDLVLIEGG